MTAKTTTAAQVARGKAAPTKRKRADWEAVERDYRTGKFTLRELEARHGPSNSTIARRVEREGWTKDLTEAIRQATAAKLVAEIATQQECSKAQQNAATTVLAAAELNKQVILGHRKELLNARALANNMLAELTRAATLDGDAELIAEVLAGDADEAALSRARMAVQRAVGLSSRVTSLKALAETYTKLHTGERVAFSLDDDPDGQKDVPMSDAERASRLATLLARARVAAANADGD